MTIASNRTAWLLAMAIAVVAAFAVALTYAEISHTSDEPAHIYTGMEWWLTGDYTIEELHPPLARVAAAAGLYLNGIVPSSVKGKTSRQEITAALYEKSWDQSRQLLYEGGDIYHRLALARMGILPFYVLSMLVVFAWARHLFGNETALLSLLLYATLPTVSAHAGLATTDMPYAALAVATLYAFARWLESPSRAHGLWLGVAGALALSAKFSALMQLPAALLAMAAWHGYRARPVAWKDYLRRLPLIFLVAAFVLSAIYRFHPVEPLIEGIRQVLEKNAQGHANVFWGELRPQGHWLYFPVAWFFKTPLPFLICMALSIYALSRHELRSWLPSPVHGRGVGRGDFWLPVLAAAAIMAVSMPSHINIGVRHVLPVDALLAVVCGAGLLWLARHFGKPLGAIAATALVTWQGYGFAAAHPDRISYFNALAGEHPSWVASDSNFDWGQDNLRLIYILKAHKVKAVALCMPHVIQDIYPLLNQEFTLLPCPDRPTPGWLAVTNDTVMLKSEHKPLPWLAGYTPTESIGRTAKLYYIDK